MNEIEEFLKTHPVASLAFRDRVMWHGTSGTWYVSTGGKPLYVGTDLSRALEVLKGGEK